MLNSIKRRLTGGGGAADAGATPASDARAGSPSGSGRSSPVSAGSAAGGRAGGSPASAPPHHVDPDAVPRADVDLPPVPRRERRRSSIALGGPGMATTPAKLALQALASDPSIQVLLKDAPSAKREALFKQKLTLCTFTEFDWDSNAPPEVAAREAKKKALLDLMDTINTPQGAKLLTEAVYGDVIAMVNANIFRAFPPSYKANGSAAAGGEEVTGMPGGEGEDEEPVLDPAWQHLVLVYEFLLRFVMSGEVKVKPAKRFIDNAFCAKLMDLFESDDPREREYLKTILHRIYGRFMTHRAFIRKAISHVFIRFVYETERHPGVGELLEILGSIVNGFALPLKPEHVQFLEKSLLPLFRPRTVGQYLLQLCYCVAQYVEKDKAMAVPVIRNLVRYWPLGNSPKQIQLLGAVEEILEMAGDGAVPAMPELQRLLVRCVGSSHFQIAERAMAMWRNEKLIAPGGVLSGTYMAQLLPPLYPFLLKNAAGHWHPAVEGLAQVVLKHYQDSDPALYDKIAATAAAAAAAAFAEAGSASAGTASSSTSSTSASPNGSGAGAAAAGTAGPSTAGAGGGGGGGGGGGAIGASVVIVAGQAARAARWKAVEEAARQANPGLLKGPGHG